jgi:heterodisulfide reductase subunit A
LTRIGIYICECGPNIREAVDLGQLEDFAQGLAQVVFAKSFPVLCSPEGQELIGKDISRQRLSRVVVAACSPKEHENTFRKILGQAGLNPYFLQIANIREQCAWVTADKQVATDKAKALLAAAVQRVIHHEPLESKEVECQADVLVLGAGVAGMSAALMLANPRRRVYVVEKSPCIGGKAARQAHIFPHLECGSCVLAPLMYEFLHHEQIELLTLSEVLGVAGFYGNFTVRVKQRARLVNPAACVGCGLCLEACPVKVSNEFNEGLEERPAIFFPYGGALPAVPVLDKEHCLHFHGQQCQACREACPFEAISLADRDRLQEISAGAIIIATGFDLFDPDKAPQYGYGRVAEVYTSLELERLLDCAGPTGGQILLKNGRPPEKIALVHCVGSRTAGFNDYCSAVCCQYSLKFAHLLHQKIPGVSLIELFTDLCLPGKEAQDFFDRVARLPGQEFRRLQAPDALEIRSENGQIAISYLDISGSWEKVSVDMVVLAPAMQGARNAGELARIFDLPQGAGGFFKGEANRLAPVATARKGILVAGCAQAPMDIASAIAQGQAAAGLIHSSLTPGAKLPLEPVTAEIDADLCSGCKICISLCSCQALCYDDAAGVAAINAVLCRGCGVCAAACPSGAIKAHHFSDQALSAEIGGLLSDERF